MEHLLPALKQDYNYLVEKYQPKEYVPSGMITELDVIRAHFLIADYFISEGEEVHYGIKNYNLLASAVDRQFVGFCGKDKWTDHYHKMATLYFGLNKDHAFEDGNKRVALLALLLYLDRVNLTIVCPKKEFEELSVRVAANQLHLYKQFNKFSKGDDAEVRFIAWMIRKNTRQKDKRVYSITFAELDQRLHKYGYWLEYDKGVADVCKYKKDSIIDYFRVKKKVVKVIQIGYPGAKRQVNIKALKEVLKATNLDEKHGVDSQVFFYGAIPEYKLIDEYRHPLRRLKDR